MSESNSGGKSPGGMRRGPRNPGVRAATIVLGLACLAVIAVSVFFMTRKVDAFNRSEERSLWLLQPVGSRAFEFSGRPVEVRDELDAEGRELVVIRYGDRELELPATVPPGNPALPGLVRHRDWMQLVRFAEANAGNIEAFNEKLDEGVIRDRLTVVVRRPLVQDERTLGQGWRKQWMFDFYEFEPEGGWRTETWKYPSGRTQDKPKEGALVEGTWQYDAALSVMPKLGKPNPKFKGDALHAMEWTLPAAAFSGLGLMVAVLVLLAPRRHGW